MKIWMFVVNICNKTSEASCTIILILNGAHIVDTIGEMSFHIWQSCRDGRFTMFTFLPNNLKLCNQSKIWQSDPNEIISCELLSHPLFDHDDAFSKWLEWGAFANSTQILDCLALQVPLSPAQSTNYNKLCACMCLKLKVAIEIKLCRTLCCNFRTWNWYTLPYRRACNVIAAHHHLRESNLAF